MSFQTFKQGGRTYPGARQAVLQGVQSAVKEKLRGAMLVGLSELERRAKEKAPVRDVFFHGRRPPESAGLRAERALASQGIKVIHKSLERQRAFLTLVKKQRPNQREATLVKATAKKGVPKIVRDDRGRVINERVRGSAFTFRPLLVTESGELRAGIQGGTEGRGLRDVTGFEVDPKRGVGLPLRIQRGRPGLLEPGSREEVLRFESVRNLLGPAGVSELNRQQRIVTSARAGLPGPGNSAFHTDKAGRTTLGGRLRDEIYATDPKVSTTKVEGWVISPTPYAKYQEYGTSHNRASPYMRPALYEMRSEFKRIVERHLGVRR